MSTVAVHDDFTGRLTPSQSRRAIATGVVGALQIVLGLVLVWAGSAKLLDTSGFAVSIARYQLVPDALAIIVASVLPMLEIMVGLCLLSATCLWPALLTTLLLTAVFTAAQASVVMRGLSISCGCFGSESPVGWASILRTGGFFIAAAVACGILLFNSSNPSTGVQS
jgi:putative oxidoreductase